MAASAQGLGSMEEPPPAAGNQGCVWWEDPEKKVCQDGARLNARRKGSEVEWDGPRGWAVYRRSRAQGGEGRFQWASEKQPLLWRQGGLVPWCLKGRRYSGVWVCVCARARADKPIERERQSVEEEEGTSWALEHLREDRGVGRVEAAVVEAGDPSSRAGPRCASTCRNQPAWLCDRLQHDSGSWCRPRGVSGQGTPTRVGLWPVCVLPQVWSVGLRDRRRYGWDRDRAGGGALVKVRSCCQQ